MSKKDNVDPQNKLVVFQGSEVRRAWHNNEWYYSLVDVVAVLSESKTPTLCERFGIDKKNAAQASVIIKKALENKFIKPADPEHPRGGYEPIWA